MVCYYNVYTGKHELHIRNVFDVFVLHFIADYILLRLDVDCMFKNLVSLPQFQQLQEKEQQVHSILDM